MNYIKELNAFRQWLLINKLPTNAILLWHTLMMVNNLAGWKRNFNAPNVLVGQFSGLSIQRINEARKQLMEHELIICENGKRGKAPVYEMISFMDKRDHYQDQLPDQSQDQYQDQFRNILKHKQNEIKERKKEETGKEHLVMIYEENIGKLNPLLAFEFTQWVERVGEAIMLEAIKLTTKHNGRTFSYLEKILQEWTRANLETLEAVEAYERKKESHRTNTVPFRKQPAATGRSMFDELRLEVGR
ncbi:DnaD domain-containing protein [Virgibacillus necropolis]|uniref:DnaB/C C-terminal domain-containing protein n=1 Tax=Virgibacillus necropolis TaxID=163877 RepID=A0A221MFA5_9BACI|nr:DnaD domain protein [Virgibacillus necropolis]ASN06315.1 hypothetical protein CFK40_15450 [Virgibacillus necropolis]